MYKLNGKINKNKLHYNNKNMLHGNRLLKKTWVELTNNLNEFVI